MANYGGGGLASQVASWRSPGPNDQAVQLPGVNDFVQPRPTMTLEVDDNFTWDRLSVSNQNGTAFLLDLNKQVVINNVANIEGAVHLQAGSELLLKERLLVGMMTTFNGTGLLKLDGTNRGANYSASWMMSPIGLYVPVSLVNSAAWEVKSDITHGGITIENGSQVTMSSMGALRGNITNNGSIVVNTIGANDTVVIEGTITGNQPQIVRGVLATSGLPMMGGM